MSDNHTEIQMNDNTDTTLKLTAENTVSKTETKSCDCKDNCIHKNCIRCGHLCNKYISYSFIISFIHACVVIS